eukprot:m.232956 g.232956  ORF g.232956 m.232956 type:complete len:899 (+) comp15240_c0_seq4:858-3554(+)
MEMTRRRIDRVPRNSKSQQSCAQDKRGNIAIVRQQLRLKRAMTDGSSSFDKALICARTGNAMCCGQCQPCLVRQVLHEGDEWFQDMMPAGQTRIINSLIESAGPDFLGSAYSLLSPLCSREVLYSMSHAKGISDSAKAHVLAAQLRRESSMEDKRAQQARPATAPGMRRGSTIARTRRSTVILRGIGPETHHEDVALLELWFASASTFSRLVALKHLIQYTTLQALKPVLDKVTVEHHKNIAKLTGLNHGDHLDIISLLPMPLAKFILSFLDYPTLQRAGLVSKNWYCIAKEVMQEQMYRRKAADLLLDVQKIDVDKHTVTMRTVPYPTPEEPAGTIVIPEKNVFCGAYTVLVASGSDPSRVMDYRGGNVVVTGGADKTVRLVNVDTAACMSTIKGHAGSIRAISVAPSLGVVLTGSYDSSARVWDIKTGHSLHVLQGHTLTVTCTDLNEDTKIAISGSKDKRVVFWSLDSFTKLGSVTCSAPITCCALTSEHALVGCVNGMVHLLSAATRKRIKTWQAHTSAIHSVALDEQFIITGGEDCMAHLWSTQPFQSQHTADDATTASRSSISVSVSKRQSTTPSVDGMGSTEGMDSNVGAASLSPSASSSDRDPINSYRHVAPVTSVRLLMGRCVTGSNDGKVRIWGMCDGVCMRMFRGNSALQPITSISFRDEKILCINTKTTLQIMSFGDGDASDDVLAHDVDETERQVLDLLYQQAAKSPPAPRRVARTGSLSPVKPSTPPPRPGTPGRRARPNTRLGRTKSSSASLSVSMVSSSSSSAESHTPKPAEVKSIARVESSTSLATRPMGHLIAETPAIARPKSSRSFGRQFGGQWRTLIRHPELSDGMVEGLKRTSFSSSALPSQDASSTAQSTLLRSSATSSSLKSMGPRRRSTANFRS